MFGSKSRKIKKLEIENRILTEENKNQSENIVFLKTQNEILSTENSTLKSANKKLTEDLKTALTERDEYIRKREELIPNYKAAMKQLEDALARMSLDRELVQPLKNTCDYNAYIKSIKNGILNNAFNNPPVIEDIGICAIIKSSSSDISYITTLTDCTCKYHTKQSKICKHSLYLAYLLGLLQIDQKDHCNFTYEINRLANIIKDKETELERLQIQIKNKKEENQRIKSINEFLNKVIDEKPNAYSKVACMVEDIVVFDLSTAEKHLRTKRLPAPKKANEIKALRDKARTIISKEKEMEYKFERLVQLFPNINDIFKPDFTVDDWELEAREPTAHEIKDYISKHIKALKYESLKKE